MGEDKELRNPGVDDRFTCPACYHDHYRRVTKCDECGVALKCSVVKEPVAVCQIVED